MSERTAAREDRDEVSPKPRAEAADRSQRLAYAVIWLAIAVAVTYLMAR